MNAEFLPAERAGAIGPGGLDSGLVPEEFLPVGNESFLPCRVGPERPVGLRVLCRDKSVKASIRDSPYNPERCTDLRPEPGGVLCILVEPGQLLPVLFKPGLQIGT